jgi:AcrR family transcriptional regulator
MIQRAAGRLFARHGYSAVSMAQIAGALNVTSSSLYRHATGKAALLKEATEQALRPLRLAAGSAPPQGLLAELTRAAMAERGGALLWVREYRHLADDDRDRIEGLVGEVVEAVATALEVAHGHRPTAARQRARAIVMLLASVSFHDYELPGTALEEWLEATAERVAALPDAAVAPPSPGPDRAASGGASDRAPEPDPAGQPDGADPRRERLLGAATSLFAASGYAASSIDQIAAAAGVATGTFYNYFRSKHEVLAAAFARADSMLQAEAAWATEGAPTPVAALDRLVDQYIEMVTVRPELTTVVFNDTPELEAEDRLVVDRLLDALVDRWAALVQLTAACDPTEARVRVQGAFFSIHGLTLWPPARREPADHSLTRRVAWAALQR